MLRFTPRLRLGVPPLKILTMRAMLYLEIEQLGLSPRKEKRKKRTRILKTQ
jgi:hypothetical protein